MRQYELCIQIIMIIINFLKKRIKVKRCVVCGTDGENGKRERKIF